MQIIKIALEKYKISHDNKNYVILKNKNSGKVLSINGGSAKNSANIEQQDYKDERSQKWIAVKQTNGRIVFLSTLDADYCIDLQAAIAANESNIQLYNKNESIGDGDGWLFVCPWWVKPDAYDIHWGQALINFYYIAQ